MSEHNEHRSVINPDPLWQAWSKAAAHAESLPVGTPEEIRAWEYSDNLWMEYQEELARRTRLDDLTATQDDASWRTQ